jgi:hypothetical protein
MWIDALYYEKARLVSQALPASSVLPAHAVPEPSRYSFGCGIRCLSSSRAYRRD